MLNKKYMEFEEFYIKAQYTVLTPTPIAFRINQNCPEIDQVLKKATVTQAAFITAWNPRSERMEKQVNNLAQNQLQNELIEGSLPYLFGYGEDSQGIWKEESFLVLGIEREWACAMGKKYGQNAIVWLEIGQEPQLIFLIHNSSSQA
jgi:CRISPR/Cas system CSM-associated protein Csm4 (group 5 of RAMP superfamily)